MTKTDDFIRLWEVLKDHLVAEGVELSDYEIGRLAVLCQKEIDMKVREALKATELKEIKHKEFEPYNAYEDVWNEACKEQKRKMKDYLKGGE